MAALPFQIPGVPEAAGLSLESCREAAWALEPDGARHRGAGAVLAALALALGWPGLMALYARPTARRRLDAVYAWVAAHRARLPGAGRDLDLAPEACREGED